MDPSVDASGGAPTQPIPISGESKDNPIYISDDESGLSSPISISASGTAKACGIKPGLISLGRGHTQPGLISPGTVSGTKPVPISPNVEKRTQLVPMIGDNNQTIPAPDSEDISSCADVKDPITNQPLRCVDLFYHMAPGHIPKGPEPPKLLIRSRWSSDRYADGVPTVPYGTPPQYEGRGEFCFTFNHRHNGKVPPLTPVSPAMVIILGATDVYLRDGCYDPVAVDVSNIRCTISFVQGGKVVVGDGGQVWYQFGGAARFGQIGMHPRLAYEGCEVSVPRGAVVSFGSTFGEFDGLFWSDQEDVEPYFPGEYSSGEYSSGEHPSD